MSLRGPGLGKEKEKDNQENEKRRIKTVRVYVVTARPPSRGCFYFGGNI